MAGYVGNIKSACTTIFDGMAVTFSHLFRTPITVQYPDKTPKPVVETLPDRYRGHLTVEMDLCISCGACERDCPIECIVIEDVRIPREVIKVPGQKDTPRVKEPTRFDILLYKCMYCGLCVDPCPTGAIHFTKEFEGSTEDISKLHLRLVSPEQKETVLAKAKAYEREQEEKARAKTEADAAKGASPKGTDQPAPPTKNTEPPEGGGEKPGGEA